ncbi:MAG: hypothetical protein HOG49_28850 [Candidatus Scalindua sp.]|jgi:hypothetical protein|nr:hypothetical protein [Candidatus Scalindua sp.]
MPLNQKKILSIITSEADAIPEQYEGYTQDISKVVSEIIGLEIHHKVSAINIQQKINEVLHEAAVSHADRFEDDEEKSN